MPTNETEWTPEPDRESYRQIAAELRATRGAPRPARAAITERCVEMTLAAMRSTSTTASKSFRAAARWFAMAAEEES